MAQDPYTQKLLLDWFVELDTPEGFRAELVEGEFVLTSLPDGHHEHCISRIVNQLHQRCDFDVQFSGNKGLKLKNAVGQPQDHVIPDGTVVARAPQLFRGAPPWMPSAGVTMVLEVTFTRPEIDRGAKRRCYARGGIPLYLLVDRDASATTLFTEPEKGDYLRSHTTAFGGPLTLPEPFAFDLDTTDFL
ncbi:MULTISPECIES: Uma2 family endonuclease [unclassified Streptomyces]|uniref:Uma2 family endonuclease n=1 Tax=unclassified Streptomyces TaxID=2593676 RepID=UPI0004C21F1E|nr:MULTISPECIES: Uma2 family endonuclease [unclassified Streptomyces]